MTLAASEVPESFSNWFDSAHSSTSGKNNNNTCPSFFRLHRVDDINDIEGGDDDASVKSDDIGGGDDSGNVFAQTVTHANVRKALRKAIVNSRGTTVFDPANAMKDSSLRIPFFSTDKTNVPNISLKQTYAEYHSVKTHKLVIDFIIGGKSNTSPTTALSPTDRALISILQFIHLLPNTTTPNRLGGDHLNNNTGNPSNNNNNDSDNVITPFGLSFCMAKASQQWWWLLWAAIAASSTTAVGASATMSSSFSLDKADTFFHLQIIKALALSDCGLVYRIPPAPSSSISATAEDKMNALARQLINKLSIVGLCFPFKRKGMELFITSPFIRMAVSNHNGGGGGGGSGKENMGGNSNNRHSICAALMNYRPDDGISSSTTAVTAGSGENANRVMRIPIAKVSGTKRIRADDREEEENGRISLISLKMPSKTKLSLIASNGFDNLLFGGGEALFDRSSTGGVQSSSTTASSENFDGYVVTETNFRLYVYSATNASSASSSNASLQFSSPLLRIISQFADHDLTIPHRHVITNSSNKLHSSEQQHNFRIETFSVFRLTRAAFARAHRRGITANQIIHFLSLKTHPASTTVAKSSGKNGAMGGSVTNGVPPSIQDQLKMWQETCERVEWSPANPPAANNSVAGTCGEVVMMTFSDEETFRRVVGLGVPIIHKNGLQVVVKYADFVKFCSVGDV